jgi:hypothetical protein
MTTEIRPEHESKKTKDAYYQGFMPNDDHPTSAFDWRATFAGAFVGILAYTILMALGIAIAAGNYQGTIDPLETPRAFGFGSALWTVASTALSLFTGAYVAGRVGVRKFVEARLGWIHGAVVSALFFMFIFIQVGATLGAASRGFGITMDTLANGEGEIDAIRMACWTFFASTFVGTLVSLVGGVVGARVQIRETKRIVGGRARTMATSSAPIHV